MKYSATLIAIATLATSPADAGSIIDKLCGPASVNEMTADGDVTENPDGYYIRSLATQLSHGDTRIIQAVGRTFHLCTRATATPEMDATSTLKSPTARVVKYLFVPAFNCPEAHRS